MNRNQIMVLSRKRDEIEKLLLTAPPDLKESLKRWLEEIGHEADACVKKSK